MIESINGIDEAGLLGYFESIKGNFLTKLILIASITMDDSGTKKLAIPFDASEVVEELKRQLPDPVFYKALAQGNGELILNLQEDLVSGAVIQSWSVFEQLIKALSSGDYAMSSLDSNVNYQRGVYQFTTREKKDIELFYYVRNAIVHYNGAYFAHRSINHRYDGVDFKSSGNEGHKIIMSPKTVFKLIGDLEKYTIKAWQNAK